MIEVMTSKGAAAPGERFPFRYSVHVHWPGVAGSFDKMKFSHSYSVHSCLKCKGYTHTSKGSPNWSRFYLLFAACMALVATAGLSASAFFLIPARAKPASTNLQSHDVAQHVISTVAAAPRVSEAAVTSASSMADFTRC